MNTLRNFNYKVFPLMLGFALSSSFTACTNIIFDVGDVLVETKYVRTILSIGIEKFAFHASTWNNPFSCHKKLFSFIDSLKPRKSDHAIVRDAHGHILPQLMVEWLEGTIHPHDLLNIIRHSSGTFVNWTEEALVRSLAELIFDPQTFVKTRQLIVEGMRFAKECKQAGYKIYVLSNWDPYSFRLMMEQYPDFFGLFDGIVISGDIGLVKPDPAIFNFMKDYYHLDFADTIFIDDQCENIEAAEKLGIYSIRYTKKKGLLTSYHDFETVRQKIISWEASKNFAPVGN